MKQNLGWVDRLVRLALSVVLGTAFFTHAVPTILGIVFAVIALILLVTSVLGSCPLYSLLHITTRPRSHT